MTATIFQDQDQEIALRREQLERLRPRLDEARREAEEARAALADGLETPAKVGNAQARLSALQSAFDEIASRLNALETHKRRKAADRLAEALRQKQLEKLAAAARAATASQDTAQASYRRILDVIRSEAETIARGRIELREHLAKRDQLMRTVDIREGELEDVHLGRYDLQLEPADFRLDERVREAVRPMVTQVEDRLRRSAARV